jgi:peptidylprolyl isomerase
LRLSGKALLTALLAFAGAAPVPQLPDGLYAEITTNKGVIVARLEPDKAPLAVASFVGLAEGTIENDAFPAGEPYYDGTVFHRVVAGHVIQAGSPDPQRSEARGPGYRYPNEIHADLSHDHAGALGIANSGPHTNGSQFYITLGDRSYLDGSYIVFGDVVEGLDVVHAIVQGDVVETVRILRQGEQAADYSIDTEGFRELVATAEERVMRIDVQRTMQERLWVAANVDNRLATWDGTLQVFNLTRGEGELLADGDRVRVRYLGTALRYRGHMIDYEGPLFEEVRFAGSPEDGAPQAEDLNAAPFSYEVGSAGVNAGFDDALRRMRPGAQAVVVMPAELAYGRNGFYGPDVAGQRRFVIPANTLLIYAIRVSAD